MVDKELIYKHLDKKYPDYNSLINMRFNPYIWIKYMFGLSDSESTELYNAWSKDRFGCVISLNVNLSGSKFWFKDYERHRDGDLPAVIYANGEKHWFKNGKQHRDNDLPAVIYPNGDKYWYKDGKRYLPNNK